jgi:hypothetical protein
MADYYPLIARAIAGLDPSTPGESRRALYERARAALIVQLRAANPPLSEAQITRERLALEYAVRKVESEAVQRARDASRADGAARGGDAFRRADARPPVEVMPEKRYADSFRTSEALAAQAKQAAKAKADAARREEETRLEKERQDQRLRLVEIERATREQDEARRRREEEETARIAARHLPPAIGHRIA